MTHANPNSRSFGAPDDEPDAPVVDRDVLKSLAAVIGQGKVDQFIADFVVHAAKHRQRMRDALAKGDFEELFRSAHMLVAASGSLGATQVSQRCDRLQRAAEAHDGDAARSAFAAADRAIDRALEAMTACISDPSVLSEN